MKKLILLLVFITTFTVEAVPWESNQDHTEVHFQVNYLQFSEVTGRFNTVRGVADISEDNENFKSIELYIEVNSINTGNKMRDQHLRASDFFAANQFPEIIFKSNEVKKESKGHYKAKGILTMKGVSKPFEIGFELSPAVTDSWGYGNRFVKFKSKLNRKEFGINWNKDLDEKQYLVGDEVTFWGTLQLQPFRAKTPNSKHMIPDNKELRERENKLRDESSFSKKLRSLINGQ